MELDLRNIFKGYVKSYQSLNIPDYHGGHTYTMKELDYFQRLGTMLGYDAYTEDAAGANYRRMDLSWWGEYNPKTDMYGSLILHLERENVYQKDVETLEKLCGDVHKDWYPVYRIAIINVRDPLRIEELQRIARKKFRSKRVMLIYRNTKQDENDEYGVYAYIMNDSFNPILAGCRRIEKSGTLYMYLKEEDESAQ